jgi:tetratricopeptide (TPR) repeat protein
MTKLQRYIIVCIIFLAFLPLLYQFLQPKLSAEELFTNNFTAQKFLVMREGYRGAISESDAARQETLRKQKALYYEAIEAYSKEEYANATLLFEHYIEVSPDKKRDVALYLGIAYLGTTQLQAAQEQFEYLLKNGSPNKKQDAEWYLVLTLLKENDVEQVRQRLTNMLNQARPHAYQEKAQNLLEEIQQQYKP